MEILWLRKLSVLIQKLKHQYFFSSYPVTIWAKKWWKKNSNEFLIKSQISQIGLKEKRKQLKNTKQIKLWKYNWRQVVKILCVEKLKS